MRRLRFPRPETILRRLNREIRALEREHSAAARAARTPSDCPGCIALREQNRLLSDHSLHLLDQRREIAARVRLLEDAVLRDDKPALIRHHVARLAEMVR